MDKSSPESIIEAHRARISALDREILGALNARIQLVKSLKAIKETHGLGFHDPAQESRLLDALAQANQGPLEEEGLREIFRLVIDWSKRAAAR